MVEGNSGDERTELVYGDGGEGTIFLERGYAEDIRNFRRALSRASTWGELRKLAGEERFQETVERWREQGNEPPESDEKFVADYIPGHEEGRWPEFAPTMMGNWVDGEILSRYGRTVEIMFGGEYEVIDSEEETVVRLLEEQGYVCTPDSTLIEGAVWG